MDLEAISSAIARDLSIAFSQARAAVGLLEEGATVPFVARYRKEATGGLDDTQLRNLEERLIYRKEMEERRAAILKSVAEQERLTPELEAALRGAGTKTDLEDLYLPYKPKRRTKAMMAREAGLEPLALALLGDPGLTPETEAAAYVAADRGVLDLKAALDGARQILMEMFAEDAELIGGLRERVWAQGRLRSRVVEEKRNDPEAARFSDYFAAEEVLSRIPSHRALALFRGQQGGWLQIDLVPEPELEVGAGAVTVGSSGAGSRGPGSAPASVTPAPSAAPRGTPAPLSPAARTVAARFGLKTLGRPGDAWLQETARLAWRTRILVHLEIELMNRVREAAEAEAIQVFARNLRDLLLAAPAGPRATLGLDPGLRTGVKVAVVDATGRLVDLATIYPHAPRHDWAGSLATLGALARRHRVELVAIGNGTASRETDKLALELIRAQPELKLTRVVVSEAGASVYSASELAAREFPDVDVSLRGAVSIARRLQDPLAELVKIEPKSIGVGQYQHDVNPVRLARSLVAVVEDCVNAVGVDLNMASVPLLSRISGLTPALAANIVAWRDEHGAFPNRRALLKVPRLGPKAFELAAGFLRISGGDQPLDASSVHPEAYPVVERLLKRSGRGIRQVIGDGAFLKGLDPTSLIDERFGLPTVRDILAELEKPGRDPRPLFKVAAFKEGVETLDDLVPGMILEGVVTNVANFGAFVDIGVHQDGLVHISAMSSRFISDPRTVARAGDVVRVKVMSIDRPRRRVALTLRLDDPLPVAGEPGGPTGGGRFRR